MITRLHISRIAFTALAVYAAGLATLQVDAQIRKTEPVSTQAATLSAARMAFKTKVSLPSFGEGPTRTAPIKLFRTLKFPSPVGELSAYLTPDPKDGIRHPAIVWITGGDCNSIGDVWRSAPRSNDQTAAVFRQQGIVMMFPSLRGGNDNPGQREAFYGEIQDVVAAAEFLARQPYVDPQRIYLGGHSTGGTLALLTAETTSRFRAIFSFGPINRGTDYGEDLFPIDFQKLDPKESYLRWPELWLASIQSHTLVLEGQISSNIQALQIMKDKNTNPKVTFIAVPGANHFDILAPANALLARKILADTGPVANITITTEEITSAMK